MIQRPEAFDNRFRHGCHTFPSDKVKTACVRLSQGKGGGYDLAATDARTCAKRDCRWLLTALGLLRISGRLWQFKPQPSLLMLRQPLTGHALGFGNLVGGHVPDRSWPAIRSNQSLKIVVPFRTVIAAGFQAARLEISVLIRMGIGRYGPVSR